jgi:hypothetical protein
MNVQLLKQIEEIGRAHEMPRLRIVWDIGAGWKISFDEIEDTRHTVWEGATFDEVAERVVREAPEQIPKDKIASAEYDAEIETSWKRSMESLKMLKASVRG